VEAESTVARVKRKQAYLLVEAYPSMKRQKAAEKAAFWEIEELPKH